MLMEVTNQLLVNYAVQLYRTVVAHQSSLFVRICRVAFHPNATAAFYTIHLPNRHIETSFIYSLFVLPDSLTIAMMDIERLKREAYQKQNWPFLIINRKLHHWWHPSDQTVASPRNIISRVVESFNHKLNAVDYWNKQVLEPLKCVRNVGHDVVDNE